MASLSVGDVIQLWRDSADFRKYFTTLISESSFEAFFWETPPTTDRSLSRPFEFVLVEAPSLSGLHPDPSPFMSQFRSQPSAEVLTFPNLGGDALLVVPAPMVNHNCYTHLA